MDEMPSSLFIRDLCLKSLHCYFGDIPLKIVEFQHVSADNPFSSG